jgi:hypothetical protein
MLIRIPVDSGPPLPVRLAIVLLAALPSMLPAPTAAATEQQDELVLTMAATGNGVTVVQGSLNGPPNTEFTITLSSYPACEDPVGIQIGSTFPITTDGGGHAAFTVAVDTEIEMGHAFVKGTADPGGMMLLSNCQALVRDSAPPNVSIGDLPTFQTETTFPVTWQGSDQTEVKFHVVFRQAAFDGGFGNEEALVIDTTATSELFSGKPGRTYCFRVLARDSLSNTSSTGEQCSAVLVDDASMKHRKGFRQRSGGDHFMGTFSWARRRGATLILSGVRADQVAILIDRCKRCGKVRVTFAGMKRTVSLKGPKDTRVLVLLADLKSQTTGVLRVKSLTDRPVRVDGAGISAA